MSVTVETPSSIRECFGCGQLQVVPSLTPGMAARCTRCRTVLRRGRSDSLRRGLALNVAALILLVIMATTTLMTVSTLGIVHGADLLSGPVELVRRGMSSLAVAVIFTSLLAPLGRQSLLSYVLFIAQRPNPPRHARRAFVWAERLAPWSMIDVFVFGVFVAYVKLGDLVHIKLETGVYALLALTFVIVWASSSVDRQAVWEALERDDPAPRLPIGRAAPRSALSCEACGLLSVPPRNADHAECPRCFSRVHRRKPDSISRTWALVISAAVLYIPANYYPVLTVVQLGARAPSTIIDGVRELIEVQDYPLAALVFFASIAVPMLKLFGLAFMLTSAQLHWSGRLRDRTRLFHVVHWIGRWSMIDIFMESLLGALVRFGSAVTIEPGAGAVAFCAVVILTMFAAETFDPRVMWDAAEVRRPRRAVPHAARPARSSS